MTNQMVVVLATPGEKGGDGPQFYIDGAGHLHRIPPWSPDAQAAFQAAIEIVLAIDKIRSADFRARTAAVAEQFLAAPLKELRQNFDLRPQIDDVLRQDAQLQQALRETSDRQKTVSLVVAAAAEKGHKLTEQSVGELFAALTCTQTEDLSKEELLWVSGGETWESPHTKRCTCPHCYTKFEEA